MRKHSSRNIHMLVVLVSLAAILVLVGCDLGLGIGKNYILDIYNPYNAPVTVSVNGVEKVISAYSRGSFNLENRSIDYVNVFANGTYFYFYSEQVNLYEYSTTYLSLEANIGWYCLENRSSFTISLPEFDNDYFLWDSNQNFLTTSIIPPGSKVYLRVEEGTHTYGELTFYVGYHKYKFSSLTTTPKVGAIRTISLWDTTSVVEL